MRGARDGADEGSSTGCGLLLVDEMLAAQPVTSKRVAYTVAPIVALPRGLIFMRRIGLPSRSMEQGPIVPCCTTANTRLAAVADVGWLSEEARVAGRRRLTEDWAGLS